MTAGLQAALALVTALGLHLAGFVLWSGGVAQDAGATAAGDGGTALATLQASDAVVADLVAAWTAPPVADPAPPTAAPVMPSALTAPVMPRETAPPRVPPTLVPPALEPPALTDTTVAVDPPPMLAPPPEMPKVRPQPRPAKAQPAKPQPAQPAPAQPAQRAERAAGSGGGAQAGDAGTAPLATLSQGARADLQASWGASIRARIERRKAYPAAAGRATGTVTVRLTVSRTGQLGAVSVVQSSGNAALDQAALRAVGAARFPKAPQGLTEPSYAFTLPMTFAR